MTVTAEAPVIPASRPISIPPIRQATAQGMLRLAEAMRKANPEMAVHQHLEDAADQVRIGNDEGALRHLKAAAWGLQPQSLHRHGIHDDKGHVAARQALEGVLRHHHLVRDIQDAEARNLATIARQAAEDAYGSPPLPHSPADPNAGYGPGALAARPTPRQPGGDQAMNAPARNNSGGADRAAADPDGPQPRGSKQFAYDWDDLAAVIELATVNVRPFQRTVQTPQGPRAEVVRAHVEQRATPAGLRAFAGRVSTVHGPAAQHISNAADALQQGDYAAAHASLGQAGAQLAGAGAGAGDTLAELESLRAQVGGVDRSHIRGWIPQEKWLKGQQEWIARGKAARAAREGAEAAKEPAPPAHYSSTRAERDQVNRALVAVGNARADKSSSLASKRTHAELTDRYVAKHPKMAADEVIGQHLAGMRSALDAGDMTAFEAHRSAAEARMREHAMMPAGDIKDTGHGDMGAPPGAKPAPKNAAGKPEKVLWGWKEGLDAPVKLDKGTESNRKSYEAQGWKTAIYLKGTPPQGFRDQVREIKAKSEPARPQASPAKPESQQVAEDQAAKREAAGQESAQGQAHLMAKGEAQRTFLRETYGLTLPPSADLKLGAFQGDYMIAKDKAGSGHLHDATETLIRAEQAARAARNNTAASQLMRIRASVQRAVESGRRPGSMPPLARVGRNPDGSILAVDHQGTEHTVTLKDGTVTVSTAKGTLSDSSAEAGRNPTHASRVLAARIARGEAAAPDAGSAQERELRDAERAAALGHPLTDRQREVLKQANDRLTAQAREQFQREQAAKPVPEPAKPATPADRLEAAKHHADWMRIGNFDDSRDAHTGYKRSSLGRTADFGASVEEFHGGHFLWNVHRQRTEREGPDARGSHWEGPYASGDEPTMAAAKSAALKALKQHRAAHIAKGGDVGYGDAPTGDEIRAATKTGKAAPRARTAGKGKITLTATLADGTVHSWTVDKMPAGWKSWIMRHLPYGTDITGARFSHTTETGHSHAVTWDDLAAVVELSARTDWNDLAKVVEMAAQPAITGKMDTRAPATAGTARGRGRPDRSRATWLTIPASHTSAHTGAGTSYLLGPGAGQRSMPARTAADSLRNGRPFTVATASARRTTGPSAVPATQGTTVGTSANRTPAPSSPRIRSARSGSDMQQEEFRCAPSAKSTAWGSPRFIRSSRAGTGSASPELEFSARTAQLEATPAPYGRPGGPGLYDLRGNRHSAYYEQVVQALMRKRGMSKGQASAVAWGALRRWSTGRNTTRKGHVTPVVQAAAGRALGQEAAAAAAAKAAHAHSVTWDDIAGTVELAAVRGGDGTTWEDVASVVELAVVNVKTYQRTVQTPNGPRVQTIVQHPQNYRQGMGQPATAGRTQAAPMAQSAPARQSPASRAAQKQRLLGYAAYDRRQAALLRVQLSAFNAALWNALYGSNTTQAQKGATTTAQAGATTKATAGTVASPQSAATAAGATPAQVSQTQTQAAAAAKTMSVPQLQAVVKSLQAQIAWFNSQAAQYTAQAAKL